jgi:hypothetical protein
VQRDISMVIERVTMCAAWTAPCGGSMVECTRSVFPTAWCIRSHTAFALGFFAVVDLLTML